MDRKRITKEEKERRKKLLRAFRKDEQAKLWNKVMDEVGPCNVDNLDLDCDTYDFLYPEPDPEFEDLDDGKSGGRSWQPRSFTDSDLDF